MLVSIAENLLHKTKSDAFAAVEEKAFQFRLQQAALLSTADLMDSKILKHYRTMFKQLAPKKQSDGHFLQAYMILFKFIYRRNLQQKIEFFNAGKRLFEIEKASNPNSGSKPMMVKSNSLIFQTSQNYFYGLEATTNIFSRKFTDYFKQVSSNSRVLKIFYRVQKNTSNSKTRIIEKKLESMFVRRLGQTFQQIKRYAAFREKKREIAGLMNAAIVKLINRKNEIYSIFYTLKHKRLEVGMKGLIQPLRIT